ncbi:hypothetical protein ACFL6B_01240 [Thermodesulfobacteriota bacterium]
MKADDKRLFSGQVFINPDSNVYIAYAIELSLKPLNRKRKLTKLPGT